MRRITSETSVFRGRFLGLVRYLKFGAVFPEVLYPGYGVLHTDL